MGRTLCTMTIAAILVGSQGVAAAITVAVGTCRPQLVSFPTIQAAVNHSPPSTVIDICPGT
jgi:hypothetical protein